MRRKILITLTVIVLLFQFLPVAALAATGTVLTEEELNRAYALTGLGTGGLRKEAGSMSNGTGDGLFHIGMKPNSSWNASQLRDWVEETLESDLASVTDTLSRVFYTIADLEKNRSSSYKGLQESREYRQAREIYTEAESLREEMRWLQDRLETSSDVIAEYGSRITSQDDSIFASDRIRLSAKIEDAVGDITEVRGIIADQYEDWENRINKWQKYLKYSAAGPEDEPWIGDWVSDLFLEEEPVSHTAKAAKVKTGNSRMDRLSATAGLANSAVDVKVTVLTENEVGIALRKEDSADGIAGVSLLVGDALRPNEPTWRYVTDEDGVARIPVNHFNTDEYDVLHLQVTAADLSDQGFQDFRIDDLDLCKGDGYTAVVKYLDDESGSLIGPYIYSATFHGKDIMFAEYEMLYSPVNNHDFEIKVEVRNPTGNTLPDMYMTWYENDGSFSKLKKCQMKQTSRDGNIYTFRGRWKQKFSPNASKNQRPYFQFGTDGEPHYTQLVSCRGAADAPLSEGTGAEGGVFANVLGKGMSLGFKVPYIDMFVGLNLPFQQYIPRISIDPAGYVVIFVGMPVLQNAIEDRGLNWESKDARKFSQAQEWVERKGAFANYKAQYNLARDYYKAKFWKFIGQSSIDVGFFVVATGRWQLDNSNPDVKSKDVVLRAGSGFTITYEYSWLVSYPLGPVPVYGCISVGIYAGFALQHELSFCWVNGEFQNWRLRPYKDINIYFGAFFSAQVGAGVKGFLDAWIKLMAYLDVMIRISLTDNDQSAVTVTGGVDVAVGATIFFASVRKTWTLAETQFYPKDKGGLLPAGTTNAGTKQGEQEAEEAAYGTPQRYPQLAQQAEPVINSMRDAKPGFQVVRAKGQTFLFFVNTVTGADGETHKRICWRNDTNGQEGTLEDDLIQLYWTVVTEDARGNITKPEVLDWIREWVSTGQILLSWWYTRARVEAEYCGLETDGPRALLVSNILSRDDFGFDAYGMGDHIAVVGTSAKRFDSEGYPDTAPTTDFLPNILTYMLVLEPDSEGRLSFRLSAAGKDTYGADRNYCYDCGYANSRYGYSGYTNPQITWAGIDWQTPGQRIEKVRIYCEMEKIVRPDDPDQSAGMNFFQYEDFGMERMYFYSDRIVTSAKGKDWERVQIVSESRGEMNPHLFGRQSQSFVALSRPKDRPDDDSAVEGAIELFDWRMNGGDYSQDGVRSVVLEEGKIDSIAVLEPRDNNNSTDVPRIVFYTKREISGDGDERTRLYGLWLEPVEASADRRDLTLRVTKYEYDVTLPRGQFGLAWLGASPCLYWISAAGDGDENLWRVWMMTYDMAANQMTDPAVFAEFTLPPHIITESITGGSVTTNLGEGLVQSLLLTGTGTGYLTMLPKDYHSQFPSPVIFCRFREQLTPAATLQAAIPKDLAIRAGDFEDMTLGIMNDGNLGIASFDITLHTVEDDQETLVQTIHVNCAEPSRSKVTLHDGTVQMTGQQVAYRDDDFDYSSRRRDWVLSHETWAHQIHVGDRVELVSSMIQENPDPTYVKSDLLMPGSLGSWSTVLRIPEDWEGKKVLRLRINAVSVESRWVRAILNTAAAGQKDAANAAVPAELRYVLNEKTGKLELQESVSRNIAIRGAVDNGLLAREIDSSSMEMEVDLNDIEVSHRVYEGTDGERQLDIVIQNHAATREPLKLSCAVYVDDSADATLISLPYYEAAAASHRTHTITVPVNSLVDDPDRHRMLRMVLSVVGDSDRVYTNNEFSIILNNEVGLVIDPQPEDVTTRPGSTAYYSLGVSGGTQPYTYRWEVRMGEKQSWQRLENGREATLTVENVTLAMDGWHYRCVITDAAGNSVTSREAALNVIRLPLTGDGPSVWVWLALAAATLTLLALYRRRTGKC